VDNTYLDRNRLPDEDDLITQSMSTSFALPLIQGLTEYAAQLDKEVLDGLNKAGFKTNLGVNGTGITGSYAARGGGYYIDVGACELIIDGKIKIKQGCEIVSYSEKGLELEDGSSLEADAIILATGWDEFLSHAERVIGNEAKRIGPVWGHDEEGELRGNWRPTQHPALWNMLGPLSFGRFYSKRLALILKARLLGIAPTPSA